MYHNLNLLKSAMANMANMADMTQVHFTSEPVLYQLSTFLATTANRPFSLLYSQVESVSNWSP